MTILAGIDEAGLGPYLGPLVVSCTALRVPDNWSAASPWEALSTSIASKASKKDPRPAVCDSKILHAKGGVTSLAKTVFTFLNCNGVNTPPHPRHTRESFLCAINADPGAPAEYPWYKNSEWIFIASDLNTQSAANENQDEFNNNYESVKKNLAESGASLAMLSARPVMAGEFNRLIDSGLNKNELLLQETGRQIKQLVEKFTEEPIKLTVDKQGGRNYYHAFLTRLFPEKWIEIIKEGKLCSAYVVKREGGNDLSISFEVKADRNAFCVSLASILAKYLRELFVADLNAFFISHLPDLKPTAGYPADAPRFINAVMPILEEMRLDHSLLVRSR